MSEKVNTLLNDLTLEEKVGQTLCWNVAGRPLRQIEKTLKTYPVGSVFHAYARSDYTRRVTELADRVLKTPIITCMDLVNGAGCRLQTESTLFPWQLAVGAADDEGLAEEMGRITAREARAAGVHWTFGPIVDLSYNRDNPMMHMRTFGQDPERVTRMARAFIRGAQRERLIAATAKHFPGDGIDDRDSHICTSINSLDEEEWFEKYGYVWKSVIEEDVWAVMSGHIALPWIDPADNYLGPRPATLSHKIQVELLKERLGFEGVIISDAIPMIGFCSHGSFEELVPENIASGSDMVLWAEPERDMPAVLKAVEEGKLSEERLNDAVRRVLTLKEKLGLLDNSVTVPEVSEEQRIEYAAVANKVGEKSITIVRDELNQLPVHIQPGAEVLTVTCQFHEPVRGVVQELTHVDNELRSRGFHVTHLLNPNIEQLRQTIRNFDHVFINLHFPPRYGTVKLYGSVAMMFWSGFWHGHPSVTFTSFGDPNKLWEMPYLPNYINCYSNTPSSQKAAVRVWLGEIPAVGKTPISLEGFFKVETTTAGAE